MRDGKQHPGNSGHSAARGCQSAAVTPRFGFICKDLGILLDTAFFTAFCSRPTLSVARLYEARITRLSALKVMAGLLARVSSLELFQRRVSHELMASDEIPKAGKLGRMYSNPG